MKILRHIASLAFVCIVMLGCAAPSKGPVSFSNGDQLIEAARKIRIGHTLNDVVFYLGWRKDQGVTGPVRVPNDDPGGGKLLHPRLAFWRWNVYPVTLYVCFTDNGQVYRVRYYDDRKTPDGPYTLAGPNE